MYDSKKSKLEFFKVGWLFGFGYFLSNLYWISFSLNFDENFKFLIPLTILLIPAFLSLFYGFAIFVFSFFISDKKLISSILSFSLFISVFEFIRGYIFSGFPWNLIAYSFSNQLEFIQISSLIGIYSFNLDEQHTGVTSKVFGIVCTLFRLIFKLGFNFFYACTCIIKSAFFRKM